MDNTPETATDKTAQAFQEPQSQAEVSAPQHRSSIGKIVEAIKKPFHHEKKEEDVPPALKENIQKMEQRKEERIMEMQKEGLDTSMLEGSKTGQLRQTLR
ncbi:hypothetical protein N0V90_010081 [Kalmusia sp. IMI 367209]|nr:hypothetical protein N0V90_010081 [Kalmusia sp. IMI 367209]